MESLRINILIPAIKARKHLLVDIIEVLALRRDSWKPDWPFAKAWSRIKGAPLLLDRITEDFGVYHANVLLLGLISQSLVVLKLTLVLLSDDLVGVPPNLLCIVVIVPVDQRPLNGVGVVRGLHAVWALDGAHL